MILGNHEKAGRGLLRLTVVAILLLLLCALLSCRSNPEAKLPKPKLVLLIVVDQFPQSYFTRFGHLFTGGLRQLLDQGASFNNSTFAHAITNTCPGHASIATGSHPRTHGVIDNTWYDRASKRYVYCAENSARKTSPARLRISALPDWLKRADAKAQVYTISAKDRAAVMLGGTSADAALWYEGKTGTFTSSAYYHKEPIWWLDNFNTTAGINRYFGTLWQPLPIATDNLQDLGVVNLDRGVFADQFPHAIGKPRLLIDEEYWSALSRTPFIDEFSTALAKQVVQAQRLGKDEHTDYLAISFSALDRVGHSYGPNSPEVLDTLLRLDRTLADLLSFVDAEVGLEHTLIAFSADHGVQPLPEFQTLHGHQAQRLSDEDIACFQRASTSHDAFAKLFLSDFYLDREMLSRFVLNRKAFDADFSKALLQCRLIEKVWSSAELANDPTNLPKEALAYYRSFDAERSPDYLLQFRPYALAQSGHKTGHGTHHPYDSHVPMIFMHPSITAQQIDDEAHPTDIAPSIAALIGLRKPATVDGRSWADRLLK